MSCVFLLNIFGKKIDEVPTSVHDIDGCEIFSGVGSVTSAMREVGLIAASADINMGECFNICSSAGFLSLVWFENYGFIVPLSYCLR